MKNHAVSRAALSIVELTRVSPLDSFPTTSWLPIHFNIPGVTPNLLGFLAALLSKALIRSHTLNASTVGSPYPPRL